MILNNTSCKYILKQINSVKTIEKIVYKTKLIIIYNNDINVEYYTIKNGLKPALFRILYCKKLISQGNWVMQPSFV